MQLSIPNQSFFSFAAACPRLDPAPKIDGNLGDWPESARLPDLVAMDGREAFADVCAGWTADALYIAVEVRGNGEPAVQSKRPTRGDGLQVWIDTRDVRNAHRASRYCHHFFFLPEGKGRGQKQPMAGQLRIRRARAQSTPCNPQDIDISSRVLSDGYRMEVRLRAGLLTGFDPEENRRLGFTYLLRDHVLGRQYWSSDESLPVSYDPSLWGTLELVDGAE